MPPEDRTGPPSSTFDRELNPAGQDISYSVITATLNEAENIRELIDAISAQLDAMGRPYEIIVVDDNSADGTAALVREYSARNPRVKLVVRTAARGIGSAYLCGIEHSLGAVVCTMDADFSHPPDMLPQLLAAADGGSLALGSRFLRRGDLDTLWYRWAPTRAANLWHSLVLRSGVRDHTNGYMAVRKEALERLLAAGKSAGIRPFDRILYCLALVALARKIELPVVELPTKYVFRTRGETKIRFARGVRLFFYEWGDSLLLAWKR
ncbi:MAG TPA: glycosyltransferase [Edaphobacter sp.]|nr:glycosyltransferase [Edaphobacter sp.]